MSELNRLRREFVEKLLEEPERKLSTKFNFATVLDEISSQKKENKNQEIKDLDIKTERIFF